MWTKIRQQYARLQYRSPGEHDWTTLEDSYQPMISKENQPEPFNVEQVVFSVEGRLSKCETGYNVR